MVTRCGSGRPRICANSSALPASSSNGSTFRRDVSAVTSSTRSDIAWNSGLWMRISRSDTSPILADERRGTSPRYGWCETAHREEPCRTSSTS